MAFLNENAQQLAPEVIVKFEEHISNEESYGQQGQQQEWWWATMMQQENMMDGI